MLGPALRWPVLVPAMPGKGDPVMAQVVSGEGPAMGAKGPSPFHEIDEGWAFLGGAFVPVAKAQVSLATHALHYGTGCFEGIRAYWNAEREELFVLRMDDHYRRFLQSAAMIRMALPYGVEELGEITLELLRRSGLRQDVYIRPLAFKASRVIKVGLSGLRDEVAMLAVPMGNYVSTTGLSVQVSSWRRISDTAMPSRSKLTGSYVNIALAVDEARENGYDEALLLNADGHLSEGSGSNVFVVRRGQVLTPPVMEDILEGITRNIIVRLLGDRSLEVVERPIDRTELYVADEVFLTGTGAQIAPVTSIDHRPVGDGQIGPLTRGLQDTFFRVVRGLDDRYVSWLTPVYGG